MFVKIFHEDLPKQSNKDIYGINNFVNRNFRKYYANANTEKTRQNI